jgi:hypothetical protein
MSVTQSPIPPALSALSSRFLQSPDYLNIKSRMSVALSTKPEAPVVTHVANIDISPFAVFLSALTVRGISRAEVEKLKRSFLVKGIEMDQEIIGSVEKVVAPSDDLLSKIPDAYLNAVGCTKSQVDVYMLVDGQHRYVLIISYVKIPN